jgi:hypothetical protein
MTGILVGFGGANAEVVAAVLIYRAFTVVPTLLLGLATMAAGAGSARRRARKESAGRAGISRRVKEQSHKDEMSKALRGDFERLRDRGVATYACAARRRRAPGGGGRVAASTGRATRSSQVRAGPEALRARTGRPVPSAGRRASGRRPAGFLARLLGR